MTDPPQTGTWEIQVAAEGTPRVRVQGKEGGAFLSTAVVSRGAHGPHKVSDCLPSQPRPLWTSSFISGSLWRMDPTLASTL